MLDTLSQNKSASEKQSEEWQPFPDFDSGVAAAMLNTAVTACWDYYPEENICRFSDGFAKSLGLSSPVMELSREDWLSMLEPDDIPRATMAMRNHLSSGGRIPYRLEVRYRHRGGGSVWMLSSARTIKWDAQGKPVRIVGTHVDITDRKRIEESLRSVMEALDSRNEELASYSFVTAHDLRSPVTSIVGLMDLYKEDPSVENAQFVLDNIGEPARDLLDTLDTLNEVLNVKRRPDVIIQPVMLAPVFDEVCEGFSKRIQSEAAVIETAFDSCPSVPCYAPYMESILRNLLSNALRFRALDRAPQIRVESEQFRNHYVLRFADNGIGIDMTRHGRKLFGLKQRFHQGEGYRGVGLFMIKAQVEAMKGSITVSSRVDEGTIFTVYLPSGQ